MADRSVHPPRRHHTSGLAGELNAEWRRLTADRSSRVRVHEWGLAETALRGLSDLGEVADAAADRDRGDVLLGLLRVARAGDLLAARTVLQVMLGAVVRLARRTRMHAGGDPEESLARAVAAAWQVVRDYPVERRTCSPLDGISLDVLAALTDVSRDQAGEIPAGLPGELAEHYGGVVGSTEEDEVRATFWSAARLHGSGACSDEQVLVLLAWGVRTGVVSAGEARLLVRLYSPAEPGVPVNSREVAGELGLEYAAVRQRASRATRRLAAAVRHLVESTWSGSEGAVAC